MNLPKMPVGCQHLGGNLYKVRFQDIKLPDDFVPNEEGVSYAFSNSRGLTESGQQVLLDRKLSSELRESIKKQTLLNPLTCRWVKVGDTYYPQLVGGERRYRSLDFLMKKKEVVADPRKAGFDENGTVVREEAVASEAYEYVNCLVLTTKDDLEALAISWAENKCRVNLNDGHEIAEIIRLRRCNADDSRILDILQRDEKWLSETDKLINDLDPNTLADLIENRIDRSSAIALSSIKDVNHRDKVREAANIASMETCEARITRLDNKVKLAVKEQTIAKINLVQANYSGDEEKAEKAEKTIKKTEADIEKINKKKEKLAAVTTLKDVKDAAEELADDDDLDKQVEPQRYRILSYKKIMGLTAYVDELVDSNVTIDFGRGKESTSYPEKLEHFALVRKVLSEIILANNDNFQSVILDFLETKRNS